jgi:hypothetical protein
MIKLNKYRQENGNIYRLTFLGFQRFIVVARYAVSNRKAYCLFDNHFDAFDFLADW